MKKQIQNAKNDNITIFRYKVENLEKEILQEHNRIKKEVAIPVAKEYAVMNPSKPEAECTQDVYTGVINGAYTKLGVIAKKELQSGIEEHHISADKEEADKKLSELEAELEVKETELRLKKGELKSCDKKIQKKAQDYKWTRLILFFLLGIDTLISGSALQAAGFNLLTSYIIGLGIAVGIFFVAEHLPELIAKGKTTAQKRLIAVVAFLGLFVVFYILGTFRANSFRGGADFGNGTSALYFAGLNLFFSVVATLVVYFKGLSPQEKDRHEHFKITKKEADKLQAEVNQLKKKIDEVRKSKKESELARQQILIYAQDIQELIQRLYEDSMKTFISTNCIHRSDGRVPKFFADPLPVIPSFAYTLNF